mgnify:FL=1
MLFRSLPVAGTIVVAVAGTVTTAYTITNPGGLITFSSAPGLGDIVTAGFEFDRPVRFNQSDETMNMRLDRGYLANWAGISCLETLDEEELPERWYPGGSSGVLTVNQDVTMTFDVELWTVVNSSVSTINAFLPPPDRLPGGPRVFRFVSMSTSSGNIQIRDDAGNTVGSAITPGQSKSIALSRTGSNALWLIY